jgi:hypothetical protein
VRVGSPLASNRYTYDVRYADGDEEKGVARLRVRRVGEVEAAVLAAGQRVEARFRGGKQAFPGVIIWSDGEKGQWEETDDADDDEEGAAAAAGGGGGEGGGGGGAATRRWRPTAPTKLCMIEYDDGDKEASVPRHLVFARCVPPPPAAVAQRDAEAAEAAAVAEEEERRREEEAEAEAAAASDTAAAAAAARALALLSPTRPPPDSSSSSSSNGDGAGDAGAAEKAIAAIFALFDRDDDGLWVLSDWDAHQTALGEESFTSQGGGMGDICGMLGVPPQETTGTRGRGEGKGDGEAATGPDALRRYYEIDDGNDAVADLEKLMPLMQKTIEFAAANAATAAASAAEGDAALLPPVRVLAVGAAVEARFRGGPKYFPGTVLGVFCDGEHVDVGADSSAPWPEDRAAMLKALSYDVRFDDGDEEKGVSALRVRWEGARMKKTLSAGAYVEARYGGGQKLFPGTVTKRNPGKDNTYLVTYDDGDTEKSVKREFIMAEWC